MMLYSTVLYCAIRYDTILYDTVRCCTLLYDAVWVLQYTVWCCTVLDYTILYCTVQCWTIPYHTILSLAVRYCTILYDTIARYIVRMVAHRQNYHTSQNRCTCQHHMILILFYEVNGHWLGWWGSWPVSPRHLHLLISCIVLFFMCMSPMDLGPPLVSS